MNERKYTVELSKDEILAIIGAIQFIEQTTTIDQNMDFLFGGNKYKFLFSIHDKFTHILLSKQNTIDSEPSHVLNINEMPEPAGHGF